MAAPLVPILIGAYRAYKMYKTAKFIKSGYDAVKKATPSMVAAAKAVNNTEGTLNVSKPSKVAAVKDKIIDAKNFFTVTAKDVIEENKNGTGNILDTVKSTLNKKGIDHQKLTGLAGDVGKLVQDVSKGVRRGMK